MQRYFSRSFVLVSIIISIVFLINTRYIYSVSLKDDAESYRDEGYKAQQTGKIDEAISWYQKAASLDPNYAAPHNDLGILFESKGWLDRAEAEYTEAVSIDSNYAKAHTNLALLYERKGELEKAAFHWMRRYKLGTPQDPWTEEAKQRLEKIGLLKKEDTAKAAVKQPLPKVEQIAKESIFKKPAKAEKTKYASGEWTLIGSMREPSEKKKTGAETKQASRREKSDLDRDSLDESLRLAEERLRQEKERDVKVKLIEEKPSTAKRFAGREIDVEQAASNKKSDLDKELRESLRLAEERLRQEKKKDVKAKPIEEKPYTVKRPESEYSAGRYYQKANNYFAKGEYSRALDTIRSAKKTYPDDKGLLSLEESVKNKMKEERIKDYYNEGLMRYRENNFSGARKEFEAILNILPE
ncbi:MAG: tetratricopeptide repeat protein [Candidatus Omnitrophota bacterium]